MYKMKLGMALILSLASTGFSQSSNASLGDDYARAALRAVIFTNQTGITVQRISVLLDEADVEASTPAEEASLKEINHILGIWIRQPSTDTRPASRLSKRT
jgi:hypothetical protein